MHCRHQQFNSCSPLRQISSPSIYCYFSPYCRHRSDALSFWCNCTSILNLSGCSVNIYTGPVTMTSRLDRSSTYNCVFSSYIYTLQVLLYFNCHLCMCVCSQVVSTLCTGKRFFCMISFDSFEKNHSCPATLMHPRVHGCTLASRHRLVYMGFIHCGGAFQTPTHYGTNHGDSYRDRR